MGSLNSKTQDAALDTWAPLCFFNPFLLGRKKREANPLVHYPNGAAVPYHGANIAATNAHLASKGYLGFPFIYGRKKREADPLVHYPNGAAVPYDGANLAATNAHLLSKG